MKNSNSVYVIAEVGINHCGEMDRAFELIDVAVNSGANAVKFQSFKTDQLVRPDQPKMPYQTGSEDGSASQYGMLKAVELNENQHVELIGYCRTREIDFISTPYDVESADLLAGLNVAAIKIASTDATNIPFLKYVTTLGLPIIYSTGASELWEIVKTVKEAFGDFERSKLTLLHCVSNYPAPLEELNLRCIEQMKEMFKCRVGFSDHCGSLLTGAYAVCAGAQIIEKHITFDKDAPGPDHRASLEPAEFCRYVEHIREAEISLGSDFKTVQPSEQNIKHYMQKSLVVLADIPAGTILEPKHITTMRPANGISPLFYHDVIGKILVHDKTSREVIKWEDIRDA